MSDLISRKWLMECVDEGWIKFDTEKDKNIYVHLVRDIAPSAQPEQYTKEELKTFLHALSLRLLSLRSAQHWREDEKRAKEIEFLAHLYEKVEADMKGKA